VSKKIKTSYLETVRITREYTGEELDGKRVIYEPHGMRVFGTLFIDKGDLYIAWDDDTAPTEVNAPDAALVLMDCQVLDADVVRNTQIVIDVLTRV